MTNNNLFNDDTIRLRCAGCGRVFDITGLKQCSACKELFCAECQKTHDCTAERPAVPAALIPVPQITEREETPAPMSDDEAYSAYVRSLNPFIECEECGESYPQSDMWKCPDCGIVLCQICREKHRCPKPEPEKKGVLAFLPVLGSKIAERNADTQEKEGGDAEEEQIVCDGCGKAYPKSKMRRCQNCGAVLCPKCRILHSCAGHGDKKGKDKDKDKQQKDAAQKEAAQNDAAEQLFGTQTATPVKETPQNKESSETKTPEPQEIKDKKKGEKPEAKESVPQSTDAKGKKEEEEQIVCDGCGNSFPKSKMRKCRECGDVLCPKCRKKHVCRTKEGET